MSKAQSAAKAASKSRKKPPAAKPPAAKPLPEQPVSTMHVVSANVEASRIEVVVEGSDLHKLMTPAARELAYAVRLEHGMADAGIEARGSTYVTDEERAAAEKEGRNVERWRRDFLITQML